MSDTVRRPTATWLGSISTRGRYWRTLQGDQSP